MTQRSDSPRSAGVEPVSGRYPGGVPEPSAQRGEPSTSDVAKDQAGEVAKTASDAGKHVAGVAGEQAGQVASEATHQVKQLVQQTRSELTEQAATQQKRVASGLRSLSKELSAMAHGSEQPGMATDLAQQAGERANAVASWLEEREPGHVVDEITRFARQRPAAFLALAAGAGFLVGRLGRGLKAASDDSNDNGNDASPQDFGNTPNPRIANTRPQGYATAPQPQPAVPAHTGLRPQRIPTTRLPTAAGTELPAAGTELPATGTELPATGTGLPAGAQWAGSGAVSAPYGGRPHDPDAPAPSLGELFGEVSNDLSELVRQELALAKAEATQTATRAGKGIGMFAGAALGGYFVLLFLSVAGWWGLGDAIGHAWSALVVMLIWAVIAVVLAMMGRTAFAAAKGLPQTTDTVKRIPDALTPNPEETR